MQISLNNVVPLLFLFATVAGAGGAAHAQTGATQSYPKLEASFRLPNLTGNPFDYTENDVQVTLARPGGSEVTLPAFFDGDATWRVRYTPTAPGAYRIVRVTRNKQEVQPADLTPRTFTATGEARPGFVRRDPAHPTRFRFDSGAVYYPLGHNVAWRNGNGPDVDAIFDKMGAAGENWSRVWMNHWDRKNLDWVPDKKIPLGTLDLDVARRWDRIVEAADRNGIHFQMTLQHHGQYTTFNDANWSENPWNVASGGFLQTPEEFFTSERARALTRAKYRYIVARWGYSPGVLAWELFNEVEWTNAIRGKKEATVAAWHREMATFLRAQDPFHHLVTTSSDRGIAGLYDAMDYIQPHVYPPDAIAAATALKPSEKPMFYGEIGPGGGGGPNADRSAFLHNVLWASLMSASSGAAQYWFWDLVERDNQYGQFQSAMAFVRAAGPERLAALPTVALDVQTPDRGAVIIGPGAGWAEAAKTEFTLSAAGTADGLSALPSYLQGDANRARFPQLTLHVDFPRAGTCTVRVVQASKSGAHLVVRLDGAVAAERDFPAAERDTRLNETLEVAVPAGKHTLRLENTGADWVVWRSITLAPYGPSARALAKADARSAVLWLHRSTENNKPETPTATESAGTITLPTLAPGAYRVTWWDTAAGKPQSTENVTVAAGTPPRLRLPTFAGNDIAAFVAPSGDKAASADNVRPSPAAYRQLAEATESNLRQHVLAPWFPRAVDREIGGFVQNFDAQWNPIAPRDERSVVYQARLTWTAAQAARRYPAEAAAYTSATRHGLAFLRDVLWDKRGGGGFLWAVGPAGTPDTARGGEKHAYGNAFGLYAAAAAYQTTRDPSALDLARQAFRWLEAHAHDPKNGGYYEALTRDGTPILTPPAPGQNDPIGTVYGRKSMNTHIHLLEAFAALYPLWPDSLLKTRLDEVFRIVRDKIATDKGYLNLFFTPDWKPVPDHDSFGHDMETAFLLVEAAETLGKPNDAKTWRIARALVDHALQYGWDDAHGGFYDSGPAFGAATRRDKVWWTEAEGLNALLLMHERFGRQTPRYFDSFVRQWEFITRHQVDRENTGWRSTVAADGTPVPSEPKSSAWKDPYHQGRALMNVTSRLRHLAETPQ